LKDLETEDDISAIYKHFFIKFNEIEEIFNKKQLQVLIDFTKQKFSIQKKKEIYKIIIESIPEEKKSVLKDFFHLMNTVSEYNTQTKVFLKIKIRKKN
jgi:hypothetical protein